MDGNPDSNRIRLSFLGLVKLSKTLFGANHHISAESFIKVKLFHEYHLSDELTKMMMPVCTKTAVHIFQTGSMDFVSFATFVYKKGYLVQFYLKNAVTRYN